MRFFKVCLLLVLLECVTSSTLRDLFNALEQKEQERKQVTQGPIKKEKVPPKEEQRSAVDDAEILEKVLELLEARKKAKQQDKKPASENKKTVTVDEKTVTYKDQKFGPSGLDLRNFGPQGEPHVRNFGPQGGPDPEQKRNFGPQGEPDTGSHLQERNFGMYGRELEKLDPKKDSRFGPSGLDLFERNFGPYGRRYLRTMIDEELEKLLAKTKTKQ